MPKVILILIHFALFLTIESVYTYFHLNFEGNLIKRTSEIGRNLYKNGWHRPKIGEKWG